MKTQITFSRLALMGLALMAAMPATAQLHVTMLGDVGIGTTTPNAKLHVSKNVTHTSYTAQFEDYTTTQSFKLGIYNYHYSPDQATIYGIENFTYTDYSASPGANFAIGLYNSTDGSRGYAYGMYNSTYLSDGATGTEYGLYNYSYSGSSSSSYGIYNTMYTPSGNSAGRWGIYNYVYPNAGLCYGIYSSTSGAGNYAGYFDGNVHVNGSLTVTSDERKKQGIADVNDAMNLVQKMKGHTYTFKEDPNLNLPEGQQFGFLAQELEQVLPSLVRTVENPTHPTGTPSDKATHKKGEAPALPADGAIETETIKSVNYIAVIPILVEALKEQQAQIEAYRTEVEELRKEVGNR